MTQRLNLIAQKQMLHKYTDQLDKVLAKFKEDQLAVLNIAVTEWQTTPDFLQRSLERLVEGLSVLNSTKLKVEEELRDFTNKLEQNLEPADILAEYQEWVENPQQKILEAFEYSSILQARIDGFKAHIERSPFSFTTEITSDSTAPTVTKRLELPTIPIPTFNGDIWEWDNFWELFSTNVHSQKISDLHKFNYLISSLKGEPLQAIKKFQINNENYQKAIDLLCSKYGNSEELILQLLEKLDKISLRSPALHEQRTILEHVQAIMFQLIDKGENVDNQCMYRKVLSKFPSDTQRKVLAKKTTAVFFDMQTLLQLLDEAISNEELISRYMTNARTPNTIRIDARPVSATVKQTDTGINRWTPQTSSTCMYCKGDHKPLYCNQYKTPQERYQYLKTNNLCYICASPSHATSQCKGSSCYKCQKRHHTSSCFYSISKEKPSAPFPNKGTNKNEVKTKPNKPHTSKINHIAHHESSKSGNETTPARKVDMVDKSVEKSLKKRQSTMLPTGLLTALNPTTKRLEKIRVLLDTGAELSFIDEKLAQKLQLPIIDEMKLHLNTFGSHEIQEHVARQVALDAWDAEGNQLSLSLYTHNMLTKPLHAPKISPEDKEFLRKNNLSIELNGSGSFIKPSILLGCDQLWTLIKNDEPHIQLPSGLYLLPTTIGYLCTGKIKEVNQMHQKKEENTLLKLQQKEEDEIEQQRREDDDDIDNWEDHWTLQGQVNTALIHHSEPDDNEEIDWEKFWTLESAGTEEFTASEKEEKMRRDQKVWDNFNETIEKRTDGYYVRLPWKEVSTPLPDNKAIAYNRLVSVWRSLQNDKNLLKMYNDIFEEQLRSNILEEVNEGKTSHTSRIHYIPHQAVLTPQKTTTKLRIVYDASAHYKGCPSLNDLLYRGPVILPELFGLLLRFRFGRIAITSDVEKAFLQVRLHEEDRDVTRCLWLHNHKSPPTPDNIKVLRFTRVTFGLIASPFLLAGTVHHHLNQYKQDIELIEEVKNNLYVDNLILTNDELENSTHIYSRVKQIFNDLNMNLREFISNDTDLMARIPTPDKSEDRLPKVLGIPWDTRSDCLQLSCIMKTHQPITKRTVASTLASVYDPMGFLLPLLHQAKVFLRSLWKNKYDWDTVLPEPCREQWTDICTKMNGFTKFLPRFLGTKDSDYTLVAFADASTEAIAACIYLRSKDSTHLLMSKGKLPSLKLVPTIPKMELDAVTLALRLMSAVLTQLHNSINIQDIYVFTDSEVTLKWIKSKPLKSVGLRVFNRLMEIEKIVEHIQSMGPTVLFGHIKSQYNAADCATRGLEKHELLDHFWWNGPPFLQETPEEWRGTFNTFEYNESSFSEPLMSTLHDDQIGVICEEFIQEQQQLLVKQDTSNEESKVDIFTSLEKYSLTSAKRIVAWILRYVHNLINKINARKGHHIALSTLLQDTAVSHNPYISGKEMIIAGKALVKQHQLSSITTSMLQSMTHLNIKQDEEGLLRCFGRLGRSDLCKDAKNPLLVIQNSWLAYAIIRESHNKGHPGISHTMSIVRERYWIPKLRAQVTRIIRLCIQCQRFNNLPYKYPEQGDLPRQRVRRSRPFEHVGLDYFGPLTIIQSDSTDTKCYGTIITCMATRLIHLDIVSDLTTVAFLMFLRRFFARRGMPSSITSDNAPTFILAEAILNERLQSIQNDPEVIRTMANHEIQWRYITPFAPWQGGFYERLIKSVKQSLYKTLGKSKLSLEHLTTVVIEIESLLNTRPLLYVESNSIREEILRPIDFLQNGFEIPYPLDGPKEEQNDPTYFPPEMEALLRTKKQVMEALNLSCMFTEKFWKIWRTQYLTSLRDKHQSGLRNKGSSKYAPKKDDFVLINDPMQPRHFWKMGKIKELVTNAQGVSREAVILLPSHRQIRRPLNLLIPLEIEDNQPQDKRKESPQSRRERSEPSDKLPTEKPTGTDTRKGNYRLRPKKQINYGDLINFPRIIHVSMILSLLTLLLSTTQCADASTSIRQLECISGGVKISSPDRAPYELCAEGYCKIYETPEDEEIVHLPPQIVLHDYKVQWKITSNITMGIIETTCAAASFCEHVNCIFCSATMFNPECWPLGAILATTIFLYLIFTSCYVFLFVPVTLGKPIRLFTSFIWRLIRSRFNNVPMNRRHQTRHRQRHADIAKLLLAVTMTIIIPTEACQQVNLFSHSTTICQNVNGTHICKVKISDVLKINPFKREVCFRLFKNETLLQEIRLTWNSLTLSCEPETDLFTRDTSYRVVDSKRCPHTGSCTGTKCANITPSSLLPELEEGNIYPGVTACTESCGGPGCDCFYWSSGCLFYRIYLTPLSIDIYELFH